MTTPSTLKLLALAGTLACAGGAWANAWTDTNGITWAFSVDKNNKATITNAFMSGGGRLTGEITVPEKLGDSDDAPVATVIGVQSAAGKNAAFNGSTVTKVTLPSSLTTLIGAGGTSGAFAECRSLVEFDGPGVTLITGEGVFQNCSSLKYVKLAQGVQVSLGWRVFSSCSSLTDLIVTTNMLTFSSTEQFDGCSSLTGDWDLSHLTGTLPACLFRNTKITSLNIGNITKIDNSAFNKALCLTNVVLSPNLEYIGVKAFDTDKNKDKANECSPTLAGNLVFTNLLEVADEGLRRCHYITNLTISIGRRSLKLGSQSLRDQKAVTNVLIEAKIGSFGTYVLTSCSNLQGVQIPLLRTIIGGTFNGCAFVDKDDVYTPQVTTIGARSFESCSKMTEYKIPYAVSSLGSQQGGSSHKITKVYLHVGSPLPEEHVRTNGFYTSGGAYSHEIIRYGATNQVGDALWYTDDIVPNLEEGATSILGATGLTGDVLIPKRLGDKKVTAIEAGAFMDYTTNVVKSIQVPKAITSIGFGAFPDYCEIKLHTDAPKELRTKMENYYGAKYITSWQDGFFLIVR